MKREFELCAETLQACAAAEAGGADRIELCAALNEGGVSPSRGFIKAAARLVKTPLHVLVRPRAGGFVFTDSEFAAMCTDVGDALTAGAAGIVIGLLTPAGDIDTERVCKLVELANGSPVTFHRAIDRSNNLSASLDTAIALGCNRVLTSGGRPSVIEGKSMLEQLCTRAAGRIRIAAGGGVTLANAASLLQIGGLDLHGSLRRSGAVTSGDALWAPEAPAVDPAEVTQMADLVRSVSSPDYCGRAKAM